MIEVVVVDTSADARGRLAERVSTFQKQAGVGQVMCPQIHLKPLAIQELRFASAPSIIIVGSECLLTDLTELSAIRKIFPTVKIIAYLSKELESFSIAEQMARLGVDDTISDQTTPVEFFRKLILLTRRSTSERSGTLILVDSGKGGMGGTSIVGALGDVCSKQGKKTVMVDLDTETQDLTRFLQHRPFINETLDSLLLQEQPAFQETVLQSVFSVWEDVKDLSIIPPPHASLDITDNRHPILRTFLSLFECLDKSFDVTLVDAAGLRGALRTALWKIADAVVVPIQADPCSLHANIHLLKGLIGKGISSDSIIVVNNCSGSAGLSESYLFKELQRQCGLKEGELNIASLMRCEKGSRWAASGGTLFSEGGRGLQNQCKKLAGLIGIIPEEARSPTARHAFTKSLSQLIKKLRRKNEVIKPINLLYEPPQLSLPEPDDLITPAIMND